MAIAIIVSFLINLFELTDYIEIYKDESLPLISNPQSLFYIPYFLTFLHIETLINIAILALLLYIGYLFFNQKSSFPKMYIFMLIFITAWSIIGLLAVNFIMPNISEMGDLNNEGLEQIVRNVIALCIWVPYMNVSKRVRNTFVN